MMLEPKVGDRVVYVGSPTENVSYESHGRIAEIALEDDKVRMTLDVGWDVYVWPIDLEME